MYVDLMGRILMARPVGNYGLMGHNVVNRFGRTKPATSPSSARTDFQFYLHGKRVGRMVSVSLRLNELIVVFPPLPPYLLLLPIELVRCDGPRADCRHGIDPSSRAFLKQEAWTKEGAVVALDPTSAVPWRPFLIFLALGDNWRNCFCNFKASCRRSCGGAMGLEGKVNCRTVGNREAALKRIRRPIYGSWPPNMTR